MTLLMARTAPKREELVKEIHDLVTSRDPEVPEDGHDRVDYRLGFVFSLYDDDPHAPAIQPMQDLLTDLLHLCAHKGWDIDFLVERAEWMRRQDNADWGEL